MAYGEVIYVEDEVTRLLPLQYISGLPPTDPTDVVLEWAETGINISFLAPDTILENQRLCTVGGVRILAKPEYEPVDETDGTIVATLSREEIDNLVDEPYLYEAPMLGITYYIWLIPFSDHGVNNYRRSNIYMITPEL